MYSPRTVAYKITIYENMYMQKSEHDHKKTIDMQTLSSIHKKLIRNKFKGA